LPTANTPDVHMHGLTEGAYLFCSPQGNILFGCPPEILKRILSLHLPMPDTVVIPEKLFHHHSSQASLEFPLYHFLFVQRGLERKRRYQVVANPKQCRDISELLRVTVVGPKEAEMVKAGTPKKRAAEIFQETYYMCLKNPDNGNKAFEIPEMINFFPLKPGQRCEIYPALDKMPAVFIERSGDTGFRVLYGEEAHDVDLTVIKEQTPSYTLKHQRFNKDAGRFTITVLGRSNGFDPNDPANGYVLNIDGHVVLWDSPAYLHQHLKKMGIGPKDIDTFILSHVHEDHIDVAESLRDPPFELYTTPEIYFSLLVKLSAVFGCSMEEAKRFHNYHPIDITQQPMNIGGANFGFFHGVHAIPSLGVRVEAEVGGKKGLLHISGDHLSNAALDAMNEAKGIAPKRYEEVTGLLTGEETLVLMDAGGGAIHGDYRDYLSFDTRIGFMHTGLIQDELPEQMELVESGQVLEVME